MRPSKQNCPLSLILPSLSLGASIFPQFKMAQHHRLRKPTLSGISSCLNGLTGILISLTQARMIGRHRPSRRVAQERLDTSPGEILHQILCYNYDDHNFLFP